MLRERDFHSSEYEYSINHCLSRRSLALLGELAELGIYGENAADVGARFVDQALKQFAQSDVEPEQSFEEQVSEFESQDDHNDHKDTMRSKSLTAQINEALCKVLCHNLCVLIQSIHELGIETNFGAETTFAS